MSYVGQLYDPRRRDVWRFGTLLALDIGDPVDCTDIVNLGEGGTPLLDYDHHPVAKLAGFRLGLKEVGKAHARFGPAACCIGGLLWVGLGH